MLDIDLIREKTQLIKDNIKKKDEDEKLKLVDGMLDLDEKWKKLRYKADQLRAERNKLSENINKAKKEGKDIKDLIKKAKDLPNKISDVEEKAEKLLSKINEKLAKIPNIMHEDVPKGKDDTENKEIKKWGEIEEKDFKIMNHVDLCEKNNWADFETSAETSGNGFYYLQGNLALLNQALIRFAIDLLHKKDYRYIEGPLMLRKDVLRAALDLEGFKETIYKVDGEDLNLIGTSEHSILGLLKDKTLPKEKLPLKIYSYSACFRKEIGSHGINEKGLWRTHQFNKVEQFIFTTPEKSWDAFDELLANSEEVMQKLGLPYRVVEMCTGDLSLWKARGFDVEVYRPTTKEYGEVMSLSNCTTFQSRDLNIKFIDEDNERKVAHALNDTALATSRIMVGILENYQNKDGTVTIPEVLRPYMFNKKIMKPNKSFIKR